VTIATVAIPLLVVHMINTDTTGATWEGWTLAACGIAVVNMLALILQYIRTSTIYRLVPVLVMERFDTSESRNADEMSLEPRPDFLQLYLSLPASGVGLALSFLCMDALTFGNGIMTAHLLHRAVSLESIGLW
jgi:Ferroportin1 (FPN1)